jgi:nucleoside-diphosphate kinase
MQKTLIIIKPDALERGLVGEVTKRFEQKGLKMVGNKMIKLTDEILEEHYAHIADKPFFPGVKEFMQRTPVIVQCWEGVDAVETVRLITGVTNARKADAGTIRGDLAMSMQSNIVHASDSEETAQAEVKRFFRDEEIFEYRKANDDYIYSADEV